MATGQCRGLHHTRSSDVPAVFFLFTFFIGIRRVHFGCACNVNTSLCFTSSSLSRQVLSLHQKQFSLVLSCLVCNCCWLAVCIVVMCIRCQQSEGPATGHLDTGFSRFPCAYKQMLRQFPRSQVATTCFSCSPPDLTFRHHASYIQDRRTATPQSTLFIYSVNEHI